MKTSVFLVSLCLTGVASAAFAADVSIKGSASEILTGGDNYFLSNSPSGPTGQSLSAVNLDTLARTPTTQYLLNTYYSYFKYFGPGAADTQTTWGTPAHAKFSADHTTELAKYFAAASWTRSDIATTQLAQSGATGGGHGSLNTYVVNGGITRDLTRVDTISWTAAWTTASATDPTFTPYNDYNTALTWSHNLSPTTTLTNAVSADWFVQDNAADSQRLFWTATTGLQSQLTRRLSVTAHVGVDFANSWQNANAAAATPSNSLVVFPPGFPGVPLGSVAFSPQIGSGNGWLGDVGLTYELLKTTRLSLTAAHTTVPLFTGQLQTSDTLGLDITHTVNHSSSVSFGTHFTQTAAFTNTSTKSDFFSASLGYNYQLTREWRTNVSYSYLQRSDDTGTARNNLFTFGLTRDFNVLGNPTAINVAERERARERARSSVGYVFPNFP